VSTDHEKIAQLEAKVERLELALDQVLAVLVALYGSDISVWGATEGTDGDDKDINEKLTEIASSLNKLIEFWHGKKTP
jgi:hypothetical protein